MSWIKENYEKAALGGAGAILLGVVGVSVFGGGEKLTDKAESVKRSDSTEVALFPKVATALEARQAELKIAENVKGQRKIDLFVGQSLYMKEGSNKPVSLHESDVVAHEGIPNDFWVKHGINPTFANAPERDFDKDGFSNREEYTADTDPTDVDDFPSPLGKLVAKDVEVFKMQMRWNAFDQESISLTYQDNKRQNVRGRVKVGAKFFAEGPEAVKDRFQLGAKQEKVTGPNGRPQDAYEVTDTHPLYAGTERAKFLLYKRGDKAGGFNEVQDRSVSFVLNALGQEGKSFIVAEGQTFSLPFDAKAKERPYKVQSIAEKGDGFLVTVSSSANGDKETVKLTVKKR